MREKARKEETWYRARDNVEISTARAQSFSGLSIVTTQHALRPHIGAQRGARCNARGDAHRGRVARREEVSEQRLSLSLSLSRHERYQTLLKVHKHREVKREL